VDRRAYLMSADMVHQVVQLLTTDMTVQEIAKEMSCSLSAVLSINRRFQVRRYAIRTLSSTRIEKLPTR
jgi:hypothetical protein